jgi:hypothetical protein
MQLLLFPQYPPWAPERTLSPDEQLDVLQALLRGGSPQAVCQKQGRDPLDFCRTAEGDASFQTALRQVRELMTLNVVATVYRAAMEGTPAAQALWLRTFPPTDWTALDASASAPESEFSDEATSLTNDALRQLLVAFHKEYAGWLCSEAHTEPA